VPSAARNFVANSPQQTAMIYQHADDERYTQTSKKYFITRGRTNSCPSGFDRIATQLPYTLELYGQELMLITFTFVLFNSPA
jgi:hypothetical protein